MMMVGISSPFGGRTRTRVLVALLLLDESYPRELARVLETSLSGVQGALRGLERDGLVAGRLRGRTRLYRLNPAYFAFDEFRSFLARLAEAEGETNRAITDMRRRPRRVGKPL